MGFSIGDITDAVGDLAHSALDVVEAAGDLAGNAASLVGLANPAMAMGLASFSGGVNVASRLAEQLFEQQETVRGHRNHGRDKGGCHGRGGCEGQEGGGSIFEQIALAMGDAMDKKLQQLLEAADKVADLSGGSGDQGKLMTASAQVTARGQELNAVSQASNSAINSLGNAASTAASKR
jgi:hypothetical protein